MCDIFKAIQKRTLIFDGAMGTQLELYKINDVKCNEEINLKYPEIIEEIHSNYFEAGADIVETNTFGGQYLVLKEYGLENKTYEINKIAAEIAKCTAKKYKNKKEFAFVSGSVGPGSKLPSMGDIDYDSLFESYLPQIEGLIDGGVDLIQIETVQDILQAKAAYFAAKEIMSKKNKNIPIIIQVTFEKNGKMLLGTSPEAVISTFSDYDLFALGMNCGTGPLELWQVLPYFEKFSNFPISVLPNAGFPIIKGDKVEYEMAPEPFSTEMQKLFIKYNISLIGGCCGTTPQHIKFLKQKLDNVNFRNSVKKTKNYFYSGFASLYKYQESKPEIPPLIIGERANATGSKKFREALLSNDIESIIDIALQQENEGAHLLDLNIGYADRNELNDLKVILPKLIKVLNIPISIDTTSIDVIEFFLKNYPGKPLINSMSFEDRSTGEKILELVKKYGASVVCLCIDENGIAYTVDKKLEAAEKIYKHAVEKLKIKPENLYFDPLTFTIAATNKTSENLALNSIIALNKLKKHFKNINTIMGISNVSYGLPSKLRKYINSIYLKMAVENGLDAAIIHAGKIVPINQIPENIVGKIKEIINNVQNRDKLLTNLIEDFQKIQTTRDNNIKELPLNKQIIQCLINGEKKKIEPFINKAILKYGAKKTLDILLEGMQEVGKLFEQGKIYLPFVLRSAETMNISVKILEPFLYSNDNQENSEINNQKALYNNYNDSDLIKQNKTKKLKIILATVKGDIHDIGKNIVDIILRNNGIEVINLGVDKSENEIYEAYKEKKPDLIGLSGLLVKSVYKMKEIIAFLAENHINIPIACGGAALTKSYVENELKPIYEGDVIYAKDAFDLLNYIKNNKNSNKNNKVKQILNKHSNSSISMKTKDKNQNYKNINKLCELCINRSIKIQNKEIPSKIKIPFEGTVIFKNIKISTLFKYINKNALFFGRWKIKNQKKNIKISSDLELKFKKFTESPEKILLTLEKEILDFKFSAIYGYFSLTPLDDSILIKYKNQTINLKFGRKKESLVDYFDKTGDIIPMYVITLGEKPEILLDQKYKKEDYFTYFLLYGLFAELTDAGANYLQSTIESELEKVNNKVFNLKRYSFGYPSCPYLSEQRKILKILDASKIQVKINENDILIPEFSTTGFLLYNPEAKYINVL